MLYYNKGYLIYMSKQILDKIAVQHVLLEQPKQCSQVCDFLPQNGSHLGMIFFMKFFFASIVMLLYNLDN